MEKSKLIQTLLFDYDQLKIDQIISMAKALSPKLLRWLGENHPDNITRKIFFVASNVTIGEDAVINKNFIISDDYKPLLVIGNRVAISPNVTIICSSAPNNSLLVNHKYIKSNLIQSKKVIIENDVWIGANSVILPGIRVGNHSIIGAGSIVTKDVTPYSIVAGSPAIKINTISNV